MKLTFELMQKMSKIVRERKYQIAHITLIKKIILQQNEILT